MAGLASPRTAVNLFIYPRVDALRFQGRGSDGDNALIDTAERLVTGQRPLYVATYLGNTPSAGPGWAALVALFVVTGTYALLTPLALGVLVWIVRREGGGDTGTALALLLPLTSPGFWELSVTGSDLFAIGVLFAVLTPLAARGRLRSLGASVLGVVLVVAAATSRVAFAYVTACIAAFMWRMKRSGALLAGAATAAVVAGVALAVLVALGSAGWALAQLDDEIDTWWRGLWVLLGVPLGAVSLGILAALGWELAVWQAASYLEVAVPPVVACVAMSAARRSDSSSMLGVARS